ncbi:Beta-N-acetylglucosaminidase/beta-glucosidase [Streptococcus pasteurianus]|nr:Beta-N-acetylglucosaminidase/beta-glucosidase [Streptococcus pasteurianus]
MTVDEKIGQLFFVIGQDENTVNLDEFIDKYKPGGMMFRPGPAKDIQRQIKQIQSRSKYPLFFAANLESGGNGIVNEGTWLGMPMQMAATDNTDAAFQLGSIAGYEANQVGCNMSFAPIVDIDNNFRNPITNTRTFGSDPKRVLRMAQAQRKGLEENQVIPVIKHFPGDGVDERDQHLLSSINSLSADDWSNTYGHIYKTFIDKGISTVMIGHIYQPAWERKLQTGIKDQDLRPASASKLLINGLLRQELGFNGLAMTDATAMVGYNVILSREELLPATINAGVDMITLQ